MHIRLFKLRILSPGVDRGITAPLGYIHTNIITISVHTGASAHTVTSINAYEHSRTLAVWKYCGGRTAMMKRGTRYLFAWTWVMCWMREGHVVTAKTQSSRERRRLRHCFPKFKVQAHPDQDVTLEFSNAFVLGALKRRHSADTL